MLCAQINFTDSLTRSKVYLKTVTSLIHPESMQSQGSLGRNVENDFNFDSYLMHEIELTLFKYFNDAPGFSSLKSFPKSSHTGKSLRLWSFVHPHILIAMMILIFCFMNN
jgi:hypothetical protein